MRWKLYFIMMISLLAVAQYEDIRSYGVDRVLALLWKELNQLS